MAKNKLQILLFGRSGVGKASLINSLLGCEVCECSDPSEFKIDRSKTFKTSEDSINGITITIFSSSALQDGTVTDEAEYLQELYNNCCDVDLILYCMDMTSTRLTPGEIRATELISQKFGEEFWKRCVLVMTKANCVRVPPKERGNRCAYHARVYNNYVDIFHTQLIQQGVAADIACSIPAAAAGLHNPSVDDADPNNERYIWYVSSIAKNSHKRVDFLSELWTICLESLRENRQHTQSLFVTVTAKLGRKVIVSELEQQRLDNALTKESRIQLERPDFTESRTATSEWNNLPSSATRSRSDQLRLGDDQTYYGTTVGGSPASTTYTRGHIVPVTVGTIAGAGCGAIVGGIFGGGVGALVGILVGGAVLGGGSCALSRFSTRRHNN